MKKFYLIYRASNASLTTSWFYLRSCQMKTGNIIIRDFRPIAIGNTGYMLDLVSGDYLQYGNKGMGDFIIGPDAQPPTI